MARRGTPLPNSVQVAIRRLRQTFSVRRVARMAGVSVRTVMKYSRNSNTSR